MNDPKTKIAIPTLPTVMKSCAWEVHIDLNPIAGANRAKAAGRSRDAGPKAEKVRSDNR
jgi:hypothetical protein